MVSMCLAEAMVKVHRVIDRAKSHDYSFVCAVPLELMYTFSYVSLCSMIFCHQ